MRNGCEIGSGHGVFLGKFRRDPSWMMCKDAWLESIGKPRLGDLEAWLVRILTGPWIGNPEGCLVGNLECTPAGEIIIIFGRKA